MDEDRQRNGYDDFEDYDAKMEDDNNTNGKETHQNGLTENSMNAEHDLNGESLTQETQDPETVQNVFDPASASDRKWMLGIGKIRGTELLQRTQSFALPFSERPALTLSPTELGNYVKNLKDFEKKTRDRSRNVLRPEHPNRGFWPEYCVGTVPEIVHIAGQRAMDGEKMFRSRRCVSFKFGLEPLHLLNPLMHE